MRSRAIGGRWRRVMAGLGVATLLAGSLMVTWPAAAAGARSGVGYLPTASQGVSRGVPDAGGSGGGEAGLGHRRHHHGAGCHPQLPCGSPAIPPRWFWNGYGWVLVPGSFVPGRTAIPGD
jgi:hypothetical protein